MPATRRQYALAAGARRHHGFVRGVSLFQIATEMTIRHGVVPAAIPRLRSARLRGAKVVYADAPRRRAAEIFVRAAACGRGRERPSNPVQQPPGPAPKSIDRRAKPMFSATSSYPSVITLYKAG